MGQQATRPLRHRLLELTATTAFFCYALSLAVQVAGAVDSSGETLWVFVGLLLGYVLADLISGVAHWVGDRFFDEPTPVIGPNFIAPFRRHHVEPSAMITHGFVELVGNTAILALPTIAAAYHLVGFGDSSGWALFGGCVALGATVGAVFTNIFHCWSHMQRPPRVAQLLQGLGVVITPERHAHHHSGSFDRSYCITTGWLNAALDDLRVWERLEGGFARGGSAVSSESKRPLPQNSTRRSRELS